MNRRALFSTALALLVPMELTGVAGASAQESAAPQDPDVSETDAASEAVSEEDAWETLDAELRGLQVLEVGYQPLAEIWGYGRASLFQEDDGDKGGVNLDNVRLNLTGQTGGYSYRITGDFASSQAILQDAWLSTEVGESLAFTVGLFKIPLLRSGLVEARDLLFIARSRNGLYYSRRDAGAMVNGDHGRFHWVAAVQNGADGLVDRSLTTMSAALNVIGERPLPWEGAYHAGSTTRFTLGGGFSNDDAASDGTAVALQAYLVHKGVSFQAEWLDYDQDYSLADPLEQRGGTSPWSATISFMLDPEKYELALRYDDFDDQSSPLNFDRKTLTLGINRYIEGHDVKWQVNYASATKSGTEDGLYDSLFAIGITASF